MKPELRNAHVGWPFGVLDLPKIRFLCVLVLALASVCPLQAAPEIDAASQPPADSQLAFVRDDQIYLINADGTGLIQLTDTSGDEQNADPAWSRDGQRLAFARGNWGGTHANWNIYTMNADGSNVVQLTTGGGDTEPAWGPDDRAIVFTSFAAGSAGVSVVDADEGGSEERTILLDYPGWDSQPAWSPDGQTITFSSDYRSYDFVSDVYAINADGSDVRTLIASPDNFSYYDRVFYLHSAWSPDGQSIAAVGCDNSSQTCFFPRSDIVVANPDGSGLRVVAPAGGYANPTWSPDGQWIAFSSSPCYGCQTSLRFTHIDNGTEGLITDDGHSPAWRPTTGTAINAGHSGAWYNPETSGQGQFLDVEPEKKFVFLGWFTYTEEGSVNPNEQHWFTAEGHYNGGKADLTLYESVGGRFDDPQPVTTTPVGDVTLNFTDCSQGTMSYRLDGRGLDGQDLEGSFPMIRAIPGSGNRCESRSESTLQAAAVNHGMDGAWFDPNTSGQGFFFDVHAGESGSKLLFVSWFTYGDGTASGQRWLTAEGPFEGSTADLVIYDTQGGSFDDPQAVEWETVGNMSIEFSDCNHAVLSYTLPAESSAGAINIQRTIPGAQALCEELDVVQ